MSTQPILHYLTSLRLAHTGDCGLLGITPDLTVYAEETYGEDGWLAQHAIRIDSTRLASVDEDGGENTDLQPLPLPPDLMRPQRGWQTMTLNFSGARHRGMADAERIRDLVRPLSIHDKMALIPRLRLNIMPPMLLGIAESYVMAEARFAGTDSYIVCKRVRLAYLLGTPAQDSDGEPYDYDTTVFYSAYLYDRAGDEELSLSDPARLPEVTPERPMDCQIAAGHLFIADGGAGDRLSAVHVWKIEPPTPPLSPDEILLKKLYG